MRETFLNLRDAHIVLVLIQVEVILNDVSLKLLLGYLLVHQELYVLLLEEPSLEFDGPVTTHALHHNATSLWVDLQTVLQLLLLLQRFLNLKLIEVVY